MRHALITGASTGLGFELADALADDGWHLIITARHPERLAAAAAHLAERTDVTALAGDVADPIHRRQLVGAVVGGLDLLVHNASTLGPTPLRPLTDLDELDLTAIFAVNTFAPIVLTRDLLPALQAGPAAVLGLSSDAAVQHFPGWGGYGAAKAALDHALLTLAVEHPGLRVYAVDPGDMRTDLHQAAFPGEDISDRPDPATVVPSLLRLIDERPESGRYLAADWPPRHHPRHPAGSLA